MNHYRTVFLIVGAGIFQFKAFGKVVIYLYRSQLPTTSQGIFYHEVELRAIESGLTEFDFGLESFFATRFHNRILRLFPVFVATDIFFFVIGVAERYLRFEVLKVERIENDEDDIHHFQKFLFHLIGRAENVRVVLGKSANTCQSVQFAAFFVSIHGSELRQAQGQFFV